MTRVVSTSRNKNGKPRKLRKVTNLRAARRQARKIAGFMRGRKLGKKELVHHKRGSMNNSPKNLKVMSGRRSHGGIHPGVTGKGRG
jgi:hypothetical protein